MYNSNKTFYTATELKQSIRTLKKGISISKQESWNKFTSDINPDTTLKNIVAKINVFNNNKQKQNSIYLDTGSKFTELFNLNYENKNYNLETFRCQINCDVINTNDITHIINKNTAGGNISNTILKLLTSEQIEILTKHLNAA